MIRGKKIRKINMENNNNKSGNNFFSGFLLGFLFGGIVVFLLATKKGKNILKAISEEGADSITNLLEGMDKTADMEEFGDEEEIVSQKEATKDIVREKPKVRRFFRGVSRHAN